MDGAEKEFVTRLLNKTFLDKTMDHVSKICSIFYFRKVKGFIYIEAFKLQDVALLVRN